VTWDRAYVSKRLSSSQENERLVHVIFKVGLFSSLFPEKSFPQVLAKSQHSRIFANKLTVTLLSGFRKKSPKRLSLNKIERLEMTGQQDWMSRRKSTTTRNSTLIGRTSAWRCDDLDWTRFSHWWFVPISALYCKCLCYSLRALHLYVCTLSIRAFSIAVSFSHTMGGPHHSPEVSHQPRKIRMDAKVTTA